MNIKTFATMVKPVGDEPIHISISGDAVTEYQLITKYEPDNPFHVSAFGDWKIKNITANGESSFELIIDTVYNVIKEP